MIIGRSVIEYQPLPLSSFSSVCANPPLMMSTFTSLSPIPHIPRASRAVLLSPSSRSESVDLRDEATFTSVDFLPYVMRRVEDGMYLSECATRPSSMPDQKTISAETAERAINNTINIRDILFTGKV